MYIFVVSSQKELEDLAAFEMLEEAADDSSFCSSSSRVKELIADTVLPSPILKTKSVTSTPISDSECDCKQWSVI